MKNKLILFAIGLALLPLGVKAQNFNYTPAQHIDDTIKGEWDEFSIIIKTDTTEDITYKWEIVENSFPLDWDVSLCDYNTCYVGFPTDGTMSPITKGAADSGTYGFFKITFLSTQTTTKAKLAFYVYDENDKDRGDTISFNLVYDKVGGISTKQLGSIELYPNPASSTLSFDLEEPSSDMRIINANGQTVMQQTQLSAGTSQFNIEGLKNGLYFIELKSENGIKKSKLIIQHP